MIGPTGAVRVMVRAKTLLSFLRKTLRDFYSARSGNVAITFALAILPIIGGIGAAVDYSRANQVKAKLQAALDSTALMLSKEASADTSNKLQTNAAAYFSAMFNPPGAQNITISVTYSTTGGSSVTVNGSASVPTTFAAVLGINQITVSDTSTVKWGSARLRVAMVLDNTGSMAQSGKMAALQTAANNFLSQLNAAASTNGDVYVSIVPFDVDVNLDPANYSASWVDWTDWDAVNGNGHCSKKKYTTQSTCVAARKTWTPPTNHNTWNGCVSDRGSNSSPDPANYDTNVVAPTTSITATLFSADQYSPCPQAAMGLSYNWSAMTTLINNMSPGGTTNQAIGLAVGWMSLVGGGPFAVPAMTSGYTYQNIIILFTDGLNTQDRWYSNQSQIDARQTMTCSNIKAAGITLYTVQISTDGTPVSPLLQNCASDSTKFFYLTSSSQVVTTFNQIGTNLTNLYVAK